MPLVPLTPADLGAAALLLLLAGGLSLAFSLGLERSIAMAAARMAAQLGLAAFLLMRAIQHNSVAVTAIIAVAMVAAAGFHLARKRTYGQRGGMAYGLGAAALLGIGVLATLYASVVVFGMHPWHTPGVLLPIFGLVLASAVNSIALALDALTATVRDRRAAIEAQLALGATRTAALRIPIARAMTAALTPLIGGMAAAGIFALPGFMTGQVLAGVDPIEAFKVQLAIVLVLAGATALGALAGGAIGIALLTDRRHRLRLDEVASDARGT